MDQQLFNTSVEHNSKFSEFGRHQKAGLWSEAKAPLWKVDDRVSENPTLRFQRDQNSFAEMIYENCAGSVMNLSGAPRGLIEFLKSKFLAPFPIKHSKFVSLEDVADRVIEFIDWREPYFFLVDMPIALTQENYSYTYRLRDTGSVLSPEKLETFKVVIGWEFPHYTFASQLMSDPRTAAIAQGQRVMTPDGSRPMVIADVLWSVGKAVFGDPSYLDGCINEWMCNYYDDIRFSARTCSPEDSDELSDAEDRDYLFWLAVVVGTFTWLKSPYGLKFLCSYHPIYFQLLDWDTKRDVPIIAKGTEGWAIVDSWTIYTAREVERLEAVKPGTCCVSNQQLHCTERVNAATVLKNCYCGQPRNYSLENYWMEDRNVHHLKECRKWEQDNPPQMVFVSYAAMNNILNKQDPQTGCPRFTCPKTSCTYHAGNHARIRALTERRTKMLTSQNAR